MNDCLDCYFFFYTLAYKSSYLSDLCKYFSITVYVTRPNHFMLTFNILTSLHMLTSLCDSLVVCVRCASV